MKVLLINGSPRKTGNSFTALTEIAQTLQSEGIESEIVWIGNKPVRGCIACGRCKANGDGKMSSTMIYATVYRRSSPGRTDLFSPRRCITVSPTVHFWLSCNVRSSLTAPLCRTNPQQPSRSAVAEEPPPLLRHSRCRFR